MNQRNKAAKEKIKTRRSAKNLNFNGYEHEHDQNETGSDALTLEHEITFNPNLLHNREHMLNMKHDYAIDSTGPYANGNNNKHIVTRQSLTAQVNEVKEKKLRQLTPCTLTIETKPTPIYRERTMD